MHFDFQRISETENYKKIRPRVNEEKSRRSQTVVVAYRTISDGNSNRFVCLETCLNLLKLI